MKKNEFLLLFIFVFSFNIYSCKKKGELAYKKFEGLQKVEILSSEIIDLTALDGKDSIIEIQVPDDLDKEFFLSDVIDSVWYVKLGDIPSDFLTDFIMKIEIFKNRIYLIDAKNNNLYAFDSAGNFLFQKNSMGDGPEEFSRVSSFTINKYDDELMIFDDRLSKVLYFDLDGKFKREHRVGFRFVDFSFVNDSLIAVDLNKTYNDHLEEIRNNQLVIVDKTWKVLAKGGKYNPEKERGLFFTGTVFNTKGNELSYFQPFTSTIYRFENLKLSPYYQLDFGKNKLPENADFNLKYNEFMEKFGRNNAAFMVGNGAFLEDVAYFEFRYNGNRRYLFRSNLTGKMYYGKFNNDIESLGFFYVSTNQPNENVLISYVSSEEIYAKKDFILDYGVKNKALKDLISHSKDTDNPVLIFYKLKNDY